MFFTSYSLMLKAFFPSFFFLPRFRSVALHSAIAPESLQFSLPRLAFVQFATCFMVFCVFFFLIFFSFSLHPQMNAGTFKFGTSGGHH